MTVDELAQIIRRVDGDGMTGAGELAEAILAHWPQGWQPIETAPKDGTEVLGVYFRDYGDKTQPTAYGPWSIAFREGKWMASWDGSPVIEAEGYWGRDYHGAPCEPTHWMPLPEPPK